MIIYGVNPIIESLQSSFRPGKVFIQPSNKPNKRLEMIRRMAEREGIPVEEVHQLDKLCGPNAVHQRVAGEYKENFVMPLEIIGKDVKQLVLFDGLEDPHNFGAALRVCEVFGFKDILFHKGNSSGLTAVAAKSSAGALFHLNLFSSNLNKAVQYLKDNDFKIMCLEADGDANIYDIELPEKFCLVIGSESKGVRYNLRQEADIMLSIPMKGRINSLNVSCALSATLCELSRKLS